MIQRHSLVWLKEDIVLSDAAREWQKAGRPFMVCRTRPGEELSLGFCLPPSENGGSSPERIAVPAALADIARISRPPALSEIGGDMLPKGWDGQAPENWTIRLIGSRLWEKLTGERYVRSTSDLDLVVDLKDASVADTAADFLASVAPQFAMPLDGELSFPGSGEVNWKEWLSGSPQVLLKAVDRIALIERAELAPSIPLHAQSSS